MGVCSPWLDVGDVIGCAADDFDAGALEGALRLAEFILFHRTARQFPGLCTDTVRPSLDGRCRVVPYFVGDRQRNALRLPGRPVREVTAVKVDGDLLTADEYRLVDRHVLLRVDGCWPTSQRQDLADTEDGTFSVAYGYGTAPPASFKLPLSRFACELAKSMSGAPCGLAEEITSQVRQGVTLIGLSPDQFGNRPTGIRLVDQWVLTVNPNGLHRRPRIVSPDTPVMHRS